MELGFKVVSDYRNFVKNGTWLEPATPAGFKSTVSYTPHVWTKHFPGCGYGAFCVFDSYLKAKDFMNYYKSLLDHAELTDEWRGAHSRSRNLKIFPCSYIPANKDAYVFNSVSEALNLSDLYPDTILASSVRLDSAEGIEEGYKVVGVVESVDADTKNLITNHLTSCCNILPSRVAINYTFNNWSRPAKGCGPLAVFEKIDHAIKFLADWGYEYREAYKCLYIPVSKYKKTHGWTKLFYSYESDGKTRVEKGPDRRGQKNKHFNNSIVNKFPEGTILAEAVMLRKEQI